MAGPTALGLVLAPVAMRLSADGLSWSVQQVLRAAHLRRER
jgi:hypothetical protein